MKRDRSTLIKKKKSTFFQILIVVLKLKYVRICPRVAKKFNGQNEIGRKGKVAKNDEWFFFFYKIFKWIIVNKKQTSLSEGII